MAEIFSNGLAFIAFLIIVAIYFIAKKVADSAWQEHQEEKEGPFSSVIKQMVRELHKTVRKEKWLAIKKWQGIKKWQIWQHKLLLASFILLALGLWTLINIVDDHKILGFCLKQTDVNPRDIGLLFTGLFAPALAMLGYYFSNRRNQTAQEQVKIESDRNLNDRFTKAIELLGDKDSDKYKQLGGIVSLKEIGTEQPHNQFTQACADILIDFIRIEAPPLSDSECEELLKEINEKINKKIKNKKFILVNIKTAINYQAERAFHALCAIQAKYDLEKHYYADLSHRNLIGLKAQNLIIKNITLSKTKLIGANFYQADLSNVNLTGACLVGAHMSLSILKGTDLSEADLDWVDLSGANLTRANLEEINLQGTNLTGTNLTGTNFKNCRNLTWEQIESACWKEYAPPRNLPKEIRAELKKIGRL